MQGVWAITAFVVGAALAARFNSSGERAQARRLAAAMEQAWAQETSAPVPRERIARVALAIVRAHREVPEIPWSTMAAVGYVESRYRGVINSIGAAGVWQQRPQYSADYSDHGELLTGTQLAADVDLAARVASRNLRGRLAGGADTMFCRYNAGDRGGQGCQAGARYQADVVRHMRLVERALNAR